MNTLIISAGKVAFKKVKNNNGRKMVSINVSTLDTYKDKKTGKREWQNFPVFVFGKLADFVDEYVNDGDIINLVGSVAIKKKEDNGSYSTSIFVNASQISFALSNQNNEGGGSKQSRGYSNKSNDDFIDDDIPF